MSPYLISIMLILDKICPRLSYSYWASKLKIVEQDRKERLPINVRNSSGRMIRGMIEKGKEMEKVKGKGGGDKDRCRENAIHVHGQDSERTGCADTDTDYIFHDDVCPLVRAFGPRKYGMSEATWTLIILSRRCAEQVIMIILMIITIIMTISETTMTKMMMIMIVTITMMILNMTMIIMMIFDS